jgi:hypothetical protein
MPLLKRKVPLLLLFFLLIPNVKVLGEESVLPVGYGGVIEFGGENSTCTLVFDDNGYTKQSTFVEGEDFIPGHVKILYEWIVVNRSKGVARVHVNLFLETNFLIYKDRKAIEMAKVGDLSFIRRVNYSNARVLVEGVNCSDCGVTLLGNLTLNRSFDLLLNVDSGIVYDDGKELGRWVPWINVARYPLSESKEEFLMRWLGNTTVMWRMFPSNDRFRTDLVSLDREYIAITGNIDEISNEIRKKYFPFPLLFDFPLISYVYSPDGMLVGSGVGGYVDPVFYNKFGIVYIMCMDNNESMRGDSMGFELIRAYGQQNIGGRGGILLSNLYFLVAMAMIIAAVLVLMIQRKVFR